MKTANLNFQPLTAYGEPHLIDYPASVFLAEVLESRSSVHPYQASLEFNVAQSLRETGTCTLIEEADARLLGVSELEYIVTIIESLPQDNLFKGQLLARFE